MRPDRMILSAYIDGEIPQRFLPDIESAIANDPQVRSDYEELAGLRERLHADAEPDLEASARRSWEAIQSGADRERRAPVWHRNVAVPIPALAAAATLLVALVGVLTWSFLSEGSAAGEPLARGNDVDVTIRVDGSDMETVLQWLVDKNMLGEVSIQLPEQQFQIVGEPVFVKPASFPGGVTE